MNKVTLIGIAIGIAACTSPVEADTLFTSVIHRESPVTTSTLICGVLNVGKAPLYGTVEIVRPDGSVAASSPVTNVQYMSSQVISLAADPPNFPSVHSLQNHSQGKGV